MPRRPQSPQKPQGFQGPRWPLAVGLAVGVGLDVLLGDPRRGHSVAAFGRAAAALPAAWAVTGARSLHHEAERALAALASHDLASARAVLPSLCGRRGGGTPAVGRPGRAAWSAGPPGATPAAVLRVVRRAGDRHPSPNAGQCEAAFAAALAC